jgi:DNA (cytosine-5)-methyltransferase 1
VSIPSTNASNGKKLGAISLYTGAGGLDLGFEAAGFETRVAVEIDDDAVRTLRKNRPQWEVIDQDIHSEEASSDSILVRAGLTEGDADVLIGGPPCQPFSKSGYWRNGYSKRLDDPRADTLAAYLRVLRDTKPRAFLLENVPGLAFSQKDEGLVLLERTIEAINREVGTEYTFSSALLRAVEYGVPQDRHRVFVIGSRDGVTFEFPGASHAAPPTLADAGDSDAMLELFAHAEEAGLKPYLTAWDAISDLEEDDDPALQLTGKWAKLLPSVPEGKNYLYHTDRGDGVPLFGWRRRYWSFLLKLAKRLPSWTIAAQPGPAIGPFHWKNRRLSPTELMRLQTFPAEYSIVGPFYSAQRQLGNAVPSALAERLALEIRRQLLDEPNVSSDELTLLPERRGEVPPPERPRQVPKQFLELAGVHEPHPGTGRGYGAIQRNAAVR